jgi:DNA-binding GntR family transcriptional regulator
MIVPVDPNAFGLVWHAVVRQILALIDAGELPAGARLPSIPDMARQFGVATKTVQRALAWLEEAGVVARFPGRGTFIAQALPDPLPAPPGA